MYILYAMKNMKIIGAINALTSVDNQCLCTAIRRFLPTSTHICLVYPIIAVVAQKDTAPA